MTGTTNRFRDGWQRTGLGLKWVLPLTLTVAAAAQSGESGGDVSLAGAQRVMGTVTAATADKLTIKTDKGDMYTVALTPNTRVVRDRQPIHAADIHTGDVVFALGTLDEATKTEHALLVSDVDAEQVKKAREGLGKVYIAGKITAIDELKLTVLRSDGVSQVIEVDEGTKFRRGTRGMGQVIPGVTPGGSGSTRAGSENNPPNARGVEILTLADVKIGDGVFGPGALKNGVFVPTELGVMDQAAMERRRQRMNGGTPGAGPQESPGTTPPPQ